MGRNMAGEITALKYQKRNRDRVNVYLDGRFACGLPATVAATLKPGQYLSDTELENLKGEGAVESAYSRALNYLSYRPRSRAEVVSNLQKHGTPDSQIYAVVERLQRASLLDDEAFARFWVENRERHRPRGLRALRYELRNKGVDAEIIERAVDSVDAGDSAYRAAESKARQLGHLDQPVFQRKLVEYLARRGFDYGVAREVAERRWIELSEGQ
ncbi:regulatory protein RecX [Chloroflexota bacterium]